MVSQTNTLMNASIMTFLRDVPLVEASKESWQRKRHCPQIMNAYCRSQVGHLGAHQKRIWTQRLLSLSITSYLCVNLLRINYHGLSIEWFFFSFLIDANNRCSFFNATDAYIIVFHFWLYIHCTTSWPLHFTNIITILLIRIMVVYDATINCVSIWAAHLLVIITAIITKFTVHENKALITENDVSSSNRCCRAVSP